jgi:hypothetical protein
MVVPSGWEQVQVLTVIEITTDTSAWRRDGDILKTPRHSFVPNGGRMEARLPKPAQAL